MAIKVTYYPEKGLVLIGSNLYTVEELEAKSKTQIETASLRELKKIMLIDNIVEVTVQRKEEKIL